MAALGEKVKLF